MLPAASASACVFRSGMPINSKGFGDGIGAFALGGLTGYLLAEFNPKPRSADIDAPSLRSGHTGVVRPPAATPDLVRMISGPLPDEGVGAPDLGEVISGPLPTRGVGTPRSDEGVRSPSSASTAASCAVVVLPDRVLTLSNHERQVTSSAGIGPPSVRRHPRSP